MAFWRDGDVFNNVITDVLDRHNFYREKHNVPNLKLNLKLNKISQDWANELAKTDNASHRPNNEYGENIFIILSKNEVTQLGVKAVDYWYSEVKYFNFQLSEREMSASKNAFHFTQVIWRSSKELGVGVSKSPKSGKIYVVCNYDPPGNFQFIFKENVLSSINLGTVTLV